MLQINPSSVIEVVFQGKTYTCAKPKIGNIIAFEEAMAEAEKSKRGVAGVLIKFLSSTGIPEEALQEMDMDQLGAVSDALISSKKKS